MTEPRYLSRAITDGVDADGSIHGHYGDTRSMVEVAADYGTLTVREFDAKYPGWADDREFKTQLRWEFDRQRLAAPPLNEGPRPPEVSDDVPI